MRSASRNQDGVLAHPLSYVRAERGWTFQDLVNVVGRRVGNMACRREKAWRWERRGVVPDADTQLALAAELNVPADDVTSLGWPHWLPTGERPALDLPWTAESGLLTLHQTAGAAMLDRRGFLVTSSGAMSSTAIRWRDIEPPRLAAARGGGSVDGSLVSCLEQRLPTLRQLEHSLGGGSIQQLADAELRIVTDLLSKASYGADLGRRLFGIAAELARFVGWASFDVGRNAAAQRYWLTALRAAHLSGDRGIGANVLKCMSLQLMETDRTGEAVAVAAAGREALRTGGNDRSVAMLTARQARAHAARGERAACERLLSTAETAMSRADGHSAPEWARYFDQSEYCAQVAACYLLLGRHQSTNRWLTQSLASHPAGRAVDRSAYLIWQSDTALHLGDVDHACALLHEAVPIVGSARSLRNRRRLHAMHERLQARAGGLPAVRDLDEQIHTLAPWRA